jgi:hypothetical protein
VSNVERSRLSAVVKKRRQTQGSVAQSVRAPS